MNEETNNGPVGYPVLLGAGVAILILWILLLVIGGGSGLPVYFGGLGQVPFVLGLGLLLAGIGKIGLHKSLQNPIDPAERITGLILLSSGGFILGFYLFVNGLFQLLITGSGVLDYGWSVVSSGAYLIIVFGLAFGSMLLITGAVAFKRFIEVSGYF